jgi:hypothetical protein
MSQANVEIVKRAMDAFKRRDADFIVEAATADFERFPALPGPLRAAATEDARGSKRTSWRSVTPGRRSA